jgi:hypothetical protein
LFGGNLGRDRRGILIRASVNNLPQKVNRYVVARMVDGELWFWGSFEDSEKANHTAREIDGVVLEDED